MKFKQPNENAVGSKHFVKLRDKESIKGVFRGDPFDFRQHWVTDHSVVCTGTNCPECEKGLKSTFRFRVNFITKDNDQYVAKIFEQSHKVYEALRALHEGGYDLEKNIMQITRSGSGQQTAYTIMPVPNGQVKPDLEKVLSQVKLHDVENLAFEEKASGAEESDDNSDIPF